MRKTTAYAATIAKHPRIDGVKTKALRLIPDERGWLLEVLRNDEPELFSRFGQVYVSATYPGVVSTALARHAGAERLPFKTNVRKLKELGLTESLEVGYRVSPRGGAVEKGATAFTPWKRERRGVPGSPRRRLPQRSRPVRRPRRRARPAAARAL